MLLNRDGGRSRRRVVTVTEGRVSKGNQNPDNTSDVRPAPPGASGGRLMPVDNARTLENARLAREILDDLEQRARTE